jgi:hypothetical protein
MEAAERHRFLASGLNQDTAEAPAAPAGLPDARQAAPETDPAPRDARAPMTASDETGDDPAEAGPVQRMSGPPASDPLPPSAGVLARNRALVEQSAATRDALADLLARVQGPTGSR